MRTGTEAELRQLAARPRDVLPSQRQREEFKSGRYFTSLPKSGEAKPVNSTRKDMRYQPDSGRGGFRVRYFFIRSRACVVSVRCCCD